MGTDIHVVGQVLNDDGIWVDHCDSWKHVENRSYSWFTFLDGCRAETTNDRRGELITPISAPRGCPEGFEMDAEANPFDYKSEHAGKWMGYGPSSWATLEEILSNAEKNRHYEFGWSQVDELKAVFSGFPPERCRIVWGYDS